MNTETLKTRVSTVAVLIFVCAVATQCLASYMETTTQQQIRDEIREELPPKEMRLFDEEVDRATNHDEQAADSQSSGLLNFSPQSFLMLAIVCSLGIYGAQQAKTHWLDWFVGCNQLRCLTSSCTCCVLFLAVMTAGHFIANFTPILQHCDAWELCPLTEDRTPDANGLVADLKSVDCLAKSAWPEYERQYPYFGTPLGRHCGHGQVALLFLNCTAYAAMAAAEARQHEDAFRSELVQMPAQVLAEDTTRWVGRSDERSGSRQSQPLMPMPANVLEDCRANQEIMEVFHHAKTLVPEIWATVSVELWALTFLYFVCAVLAGFGARWGWQLRNSLKASQRMPTALAAVQQGSYAQPLLANAAYAQPGAYTQAAYTQAPPPAYMQGRPEAPPAYMQAAYTQATPPAPPQAPPQPTQPAGQFVVTCPEFTRPGQTIIVSDPATGQQVEVEVPDGVSPGQQFAVNA